MDWNEIQVTVPVAELETAAAIAQMAVPYGIYIEDYSHLEQETLEIAHIDLIDEQLLEKDREHAVIHLYVSQEESPAEAVSFLTERLRGEKIDFGITCVTIREEDWAFGWKKYYKPTQIGRRLAVCPSWEKAEFASEVAVVRLDPGMAFGTGTHETTRLCMQLLEDVVAPGCQMLDVGCGSGILAISSVLLGAGHAVGVDIDAVAVKVAGENAQMNAVQDRTEFLCGDLTEQVQGKFEVVCANIVADVILRLCGTIPAFVKPGGAFLVSGVIDSREDEVAAAMQKAGFIIDKVRRAGGWVAISSRYSDTGAKKEGGVCRASL